MDRGAWRAEFVGSQRVEHDLAMEQQQPDFPLLIRTPVILD